jgi:multidrug efflux system membrane fusion protein
MTLDGSEETPGHPEKRNMNIPISPSKAMRYNMILTYIQILPLSLALSLVVTVVGCSHSAKKELAAKASDPIQVGLAVTKDVPIQIQGSGHVTPFASIAVKSQVDGELERALFNEGDELKRGETILVLDSRLPESAVRQAEANLRRDEALAASAEAEAHQNEVLFKEGIGTAELAEETRAAADASQVTVAADKIAVENAQLQLSFFRIASPIQGRVGKLLVDVGNSVRSYETVLAVVNQTRPTYADFLVPEEQLPALQERLKNGVLDVTATIPGNPGKSATGRLLFVDNVADTETAMVSVRARFANDDESLWPGETVEVTLTLATLTNAVVVPSSAVRLGLSGPYLLVVKPDLTVERRPVSAGNRAGGETIIASGLQAGERLITAGQERVTPGKHIKLHAETSHAFASSP